MEPPSGARPEGPGQRGLALLLVLFVASGCAALVYEVVWFQILSFVIGSSAVSLGVLLGAFMGGMCVGSVLLPRRIGPSRHPLRVYAALEAGIGLSALALLYAMPLVSDAYVSLTGGALAGRATVALLCLLLPTALMGATLPAVARWLRASAEGVAWTGFLYGANIAGGVAGSLLAGFWLLRVHDVVVATWFGVALNLAAAGAALLLARITPARPDVAADGAAELAADGAAPREHAPAPAGARRALIVVGVSGLTSLAAQVVWTRILSLIVGASVYGFALLLAVFLTGLGIGSAAGSARARRTADPLAALGACQALLAGALALAAYLLDASIPFWPVDPSIGAELGVQFQFDLVRAAIVVLPGAVLWGASFPLAVAAVSSPGRDPARSVGDVYAANTLGAIAGSMLAALVCVPAWGSQATQQALIAVSGAAALVALGPRIGAAWRAGRRGPAAAALAGTALCGALVATVPPLPGLLVAYGRYSATWVGLTKVLYVGEGLTSAIAVTESPRTGRCYHNAGKAQASSMPHDMRLQRVLGHLTHLLPREDSEMFVIGLGAGVTAGAVALGPGVEHMTVAEIEPLVPTAIREAFPDYNDQVLDSPKLELVLDDGRHALLTSDRTYDGITTDPLDPWVKGAASLFTREFFALVKSRLRPGGVVTQFVQLYESSEEATKSSIGTFFEAFPHGLVVGNLRHGEGYDLILIGRTEPFTIDLDAIDAKLASPEYAAVAKSLADAGVESAVDIFATCAGTPADLAPWLADAQINLDRNLRSQYLAGLALNRYQSDDIWRSMIAKSRWPEGLFSGSPEKLAALRERIAELRK